MKRLYLASSIDRTVESIAKDITKETGKKPSDLKLAFIYTAAEPMGVKDKWLNEDRKGLVKSGFNIFDYTVTNKDEKEIEKDLSGADLIHVNGGNTFYLLLQARLSGFDKWVVNEIDNGRKIYIGSSAGSIIASPDIEITKKIDTKDYENELKSFEAFGLVDFITLPHWGSDEFKTLYLNQRLDIAYKPKNKIILLNDWQYVKVVGETCKIKDIRD